jgi:Glycosyltransferases involved in cell wall biogenesis
MPPDTSTVVSAHTKKDNYMPRSKQEIKLHKQRVHSIKKTMDLKITAIISLYNSGRWLQNRINNLMSTTTYRKGELLIYCVNAQSPDPNDDQIANKYAGHPNFHYEILPEPCTVYAAWNHAIRKPTPDT